MSKEVKTRASLDASRFERGVNKMQKGIKSLERGLTIDFAKAMRIGRTGILALGAAGTALGAGLAVGIGKVVNLGADLDHLAAQTGAAVKDLFVLQQVFKDNGVSSENARLAINKMQKALFDAGQGSARANESLANLGLNLKDLSGMSTTDQFRLIGQKITEIEDPATRASAAMRIFGRSGAEMLSVFGGTKIDDAAQSIGKQAELLDKNSALFERVGTLLGRAGIKLQGFFVGIADKVVPIILPLLEQLDNLDLAGQGERFGEALAVGLRAIIGLFQSGNLLKVVTNTLLIAAGEFINRIASGWISIAVWLGTAFREVFGSLITFLTSGFMGIAQAFGSAIVGMLAKAIDMIPGLSKQAEAMHRASGAMSRGADIAGDRALTAFSGLGDRIANDFVKNMESTGANDFKVFDTSGLRESRAEMIADALEAVPAVPQVAAALLKKEPVTPSFFGDDEGFGGMGRASSGGVSSLAAIGGGGGVAMSGIQSLVDVSREGNRFLQSIDEGIEKMTERLDNLDGGGAFALA